MLKTLKPSMGLLTLHTVGRDKIIRADTNHLSVVYTSKVLIHKYDFFYVSFAFGNLKWQCCVIDRSRSDYVTIYNEIDCFVFFFFVKYVLFTHKQFHGECVWSRFRHSFDALPMSHSIYTDIRLIWMLHNYHWLPWALRLTKRLQRYHYVTVIIQRDIYH